MGRRLTFFLIVLAVTVWIAAAQPPLPKPTTEVDTCLASGCHGDVLSGENLHDPAAGEMCDACHEYSDPANHQFEYPVEAEELCITCHDAEEADTIHAPVEAGMCTECHDPHGSDHEAFLIQAPDEGLCLECHEFDESKYTHGPVAMGACGICHDAHGSEHSSLLNEPEDELCGMCHDDVTDSVAEMRHPHPPVADGQCVLCHDPHVSDHELLLTGEGAEFCVDCHDSVGEHLDSAEVVHGPIESDQACMACHSGHGSDQPMLLTDSPKDLCLSCHDESIERADGRALTNMAALLEENPDFHGPIRQSDCVGCHEPHGAAGISLLQKEYPKRFYAPFDPESYDLCFSCHVRELVTEKNGVGVTGFRDGESNLHFLHVNKERKGRTCRACHEVHASKRAFHIRESVPFGKSRWELELNFELLEGGGSCAPGCHAPKRYVRGGGAETLSPKAGLLPGIDPEPSGPPAPETSGSAK